MPSELDADDRRRLTDDDRWLSLEQVAERLRVDAETVRAWYNEGRLPSGSTDERGEPLVRLSDLESFLLEQR